MFLCVAVVKIRLLSECTMSNYLWAIEIVFYGRTMTGESDVKEYSQLN